MSLDLRKPGDGKPPDALPVPAEFRALGSDPFEEVVESDPFLEGLLELGLEPAPAKAKRTPRPLSDAVRSRRTGIPKPGARAPTPIHRQRWAAIPRLSEVELGEPEGWIDRLLGPEDRRRLAALGHLVEGESSYDRFGLAPEVLKRSFPIFYALYRVWFRVQSKGAENLPREGPAILAGNHAGLLPFDAAMTVMDVLLQTDPPRLVRSVVDRWAGSLPWVNIFFARVGQVIGTRENFADLLRDGQLLLVFPEGIEGVRKPITQRYRLQHFHVGFVEQALLAGTPIVPVAVIGSDDQAPILHDLKPLARRLGLPVAPITPTFPWLGPLGLLPYPVGYRIVYGEPLHFHERFGPEDAEDARLVHYLAKKVRSLVQHLVDCNR